MLNDMENNKSQELDSLGNKAINDRQRAIGDLSGPIERARQDIVRVVAAERQKIAKAKQDTLEMEQEMYRLKKKMVGDASAERGRAERGGQGLVNKAQGEADANYETVLRAATAAAAAAGSEAQVREAQARAQAYDTQTNAEAEADMLTKAGAAEVVILKEKAEAFKRYGGAVCRRIPTPHAHVPPLYDLLHNFRHYTEPIGDEG